MSKRNGSSWKVLHAAQTDVGRKRNHNEDNFLVNPELNLFVVADGMGGHQGGGTASRLAVETIDAEMKKAAAIANGPFDIDCALEDSPLPDHFRQAVELACATIFRKAQTDSALHGMGTTVIAMLVRDNQALFAHVGDSRAYLIRGDLIQQISEDHSFVNEQVKAGVLTLEEAKHSRFKNVITRSVGFDEEVAVDVMGIVAEKGDAFILCSDGLANLVEDSEIWRIVRNAPLADAPQQLIDLANERGGDDNITVIAVRIDAA